MLHVEPIETREGGVQLAEPSEPVRPRLGASCSLRRSLQPDRPIHKPKAKMAAPKISQDSLATLTQATPT